MDTMTTDQKVGSSNLLAYRRKDKAFYDYKSLVFLLETPDLPDMCSQYLAIL